MELHFFNSGFLYIKASKDPDSIDYITKWILFLSELYMPF